jgi:hypothetical protein
MAGTASIPTLEIARQSPCSPHQPGPPSHKGLGSGSPSEGAEGAAQSWWFGGVVDDGRSWAAKWQPR